MNVQHWKRQYGWSVKVPPRPVREGTGWTSIQEHRADTWSQHYEPQITDVGTNWTAADGTTYFQINVPDTNLFRPFPPEIEYREFFKAELIPPTPKKMRAIIL